jgi:dipeptidyl aminopeptidase/acylaminoacyl peptidase
MRNRTFCAVALVALSAALGWKGFAQGMGPVAGKRPMTFADLEKMKRVSDPQISPSGKWVMFSVTDVSLEKNTKTNHLWVVGLGEGDSSAAPRNDNKEEGSERQITSGSGEANGRFSPDGRWVSWTAGDQIVLAPWDEAAGTVGVGKALTSVSTGADGAVWAPNSKRLLFVSSVYPECSVKGGGKTNTGILHSAQDDNSKISMGAKAATEEEQATWAEEDACDKAKDEAAAANPVKAQIWDHLLYRHWDAYTGEKRSHVLVVSATDGSQVRDLTPRSAVGDAETPTFSLGGPIGYAWAPGSEEIAYVTNLDTVKAASTNNDVFTLLLDDPGAKARKISTSPGSDDGPAYSPDGKYIAFRSQARNGYESDRFRLMVFDRLAGTTKELMPKFDRWVDEFVWAPDSNTIYFSAGNQGSEPIFKLDSKNDSLEVFNPGGEFSDLRSFGVADNSGSAVVATFVSISEPAAVTYPIFSKFFTKYPDVCRGDCSGGAAVGYHDLNRTLLSELELPKLESYWFTGAEGAKVQGFIVRPPNFDPSRKYPVKFLIHGGPQGAWGDAWSYRWNPELMAASGYVVVMVNPHGSTGYGQRFVEGVSGDWGGKPYIDLMKGLDAAEAKYPFIDKARECALGASYGGYMADWVLTHTDRFKCIVTHDGMFDPVSAYGATEELWFNEWEFRRSPATGAAAWDKDPAQPWRYQSLPAAEDPFRKWSPMLYVRNAKTPTLVIHGQKDYRLDVSQGFELFTALQRLGVPSKMLYFPDEGHWVLKPQNSKLWNETVSDWCDRWTKSGRYGVAP